MTSGGCAAADMKRSRFRRATTRGSSRPSATSSARAGPRSSQRTEDDRAACVAFPAAFTESPDLLRGPSTLTREDAGEGDREAKQLARLAIDGKPLREPLCASGIERDSSDTVREAVLAGVRAGTDRRVPAVRLPVLGGRRRSRPRRMHAGAVLPGGRVAAGPGSAMASPALRG